MARKLNFIWNKQMIFISCVGLYFIVQPNSDGPSTNQTVQCVDKGLAAERMLCKWMSDE